MPALPLPDRTSSPWPSTSTACRHFARSGCPSGERRAAAERDCRRRGGRDLLQGKVQQLPLADRGSSGHRHASAGRQGTAEHLGHRFGGADAAGGRRGRAAPGTAPDPRASTATITLPGGESVQGPVVRMDNFLITVRQADGTQRTIRRMGDIPKVELKDPLAGHKALLAELTDKDMHDVTAYLAGLK